MNYPKMVYKTRKDNMIVNDIEAEERALKEGYGQYTIVVLGRKPDGIQDPEETSKEVTKKSSDPEVKTDIKTVVKKVLKKRKTVKRKKAVKKATISKMETIQKGE